MPLYCYRGRDGDRGLELRKDHRDEHLAHLRKLDEQGRVVFGGPLIDEGGNPCGSLIVIEAPDLASAREIAESDPYVTLGVFADLEVFETKQVFPEGV